MAAPQPGFPGTDAAILARVIRPDAADLTPDAAQALLKLRLDRADLDRIHDLLTRNQDDALTPPELAELDSYLRVSSFLDLMQAKARRSLRQNIGSPTRPLTTEHL